MVKTHHGQWGGRSLELLLGFLLILLSAVLLVGTVGLGLALCLGVLWLGAEIHPILLPAVLLVVWGFGGPLVARLGRAGFQAARALWRPFLRHYRYDHALRPISDEDQSL